MISIKKTEDKINALLDPALTTVLYPTLPNYRLNVYPGSLERLGKPINCNHVLVQFKRIKFEKYTDLRFSRRCIPQFNEVYFNILVQSNNLRCHTEVYNIAEAVIKQVRGELVLVNDDDSLIQGQSAMQVSDYTFDNDIKNGGACYQSSIDFMGYFTDTYEAKVAGIFPS